MNKVGWDMIFVDVRTVYMDLSIKSNFELA